LANCKDEEERKRTEEIIKPVLRGRDIERYRYKWAGLWIIIIPAGWTNERRGQEDSEKFFKKTFPALYNHFMSFANVKGKGKGLFDRDDQGDYWWELRPCDYYPEFEKEKILWQEMSLEPSFAYDDKKFYTNQTAYIMTGENLKFLLGVLNSKISKWYMQNLAYSLSEGAQRWIKQYVEQIPIPPLTPQTQPLADQVVQKVQEILTLTQSPDFETSQEKQQKVKELEREIDQLVYKLYGLTEEEIWTIELEK
jgi:adenine-specific DNA-methyltransferase